MSVVRHQAPSQNLDTKAVQLFRHEIEVAPSIAVGLKDGNGAHAPLRDVMRITRCYDSGNACHATNLLEPHDFSQEKNWYCVPRISRRIRCIQPTNDRWVTVQAPPKLLDTYPTPLPSQID